MVAMKSTGWDIAIKRIDQIVRVKSRQVKGKFLTLLQIEVPIRFYELIIEEFETPGQHEIKSAKEMFQFLPITQGGGFYSLQLQSRNEIGRVWLHGTYENYEIYAGRLNPNGTHSPDPKQALKFTPKEGGGDVYAAHVPHFQDARMDKALFVLSKAVYEVLEANKT